MVWIREAEDEARRITEQEAATLEAFNKEKVTEEATVELLGKHRAPIDALVQDFTNSGYYVDVSEPRFLEEAWEMHEPYLRNVTLKRDMPRPDWSKPQMQQIFGMRVTIQKPNPHGATDVAKIDIIPIRKYGRTHYAGVDYHGDLYREGSGLRREFAFHSELPTTPSDGEIYNSMKEELRQAVVRVTQTRAS